MSYLYLTHLVSVFYMPMSVFVHLNFVCGFLHIEKWDTPRLKEFIIKSITVTTQEKTLATSALYLRRTSHN